MPTTEISPMMVHAKSHIIPNRNPETMLMEIQGILFSKWTDSTKIMQITKLLNS